MALPVHWRRSRKSAARRPILGPGRRHPAGTDLPPADGGGATAGRPMAHAPGRYRRRAGGRAPAQRQRHAGYGAEPVVADKVPALLNFSTGTPTMLTCAQLAGLKWIITSRAFEERAAFESSSRSRDAGITIVYLEDVRARIKGTAKLAALRVSCSTPRASIRNPKCESAVVLFTSGSEGVPKGVELTHAQSHGERAADDCGHRRDG